MRLLSFCWPSRPALFSTRSYSTTTTTTTITRPGMITDLFKRSKAFIDPEPVTVHGIVRSVQRFKKVAFAKVGDGHSLQPLQVVLTAEQSKGLSTGAAVTIRGIVKESSGEKQEIEMHAIDVAVAGGHDSAAYPIQKKYHSPEFLRTIPHMRLRTPHQSVLLQTRSALIGGLTQFFANQRITQVQPPIITSSDCEGAGEVFSVSATDRPGLPPAAGADGSQGQSTPFFRTDKYLTVSSQLHLEAYAAAVGSVWALSPCFRAERSDTPRHLAEFYMLEAELGFANSLDQIMVLVQAMLNAVATTVQSSYLADDLLATAHKNEDHSPNDGPGRDGRVRRETLEARWTGMASTPPWPRIRYSDAIDLLVRAHQDGRAQFVAKPTFAGGLAVEHERYLASTVGGSSGSGPGSVPVFVTDYPASQKPFYMAPSHEPSRGRDADGQGDTVACFDLLVPEVCELVGGSMREHRLDELVSNMTRKGLLAPSLESPGTVSTKDEVGKGASWAAHPLGWYVDLRRFGSAPHGGFGLGFDRLVAYVAGVGSVRDVVAFPRWAGRCDC